MLQGQNRAAVTRWCWPLKDHPSASAAGGAFPCSVAQKKKRTCVFCAQAERSSRRQDGRGREGEAVRVLGSRQGLGVRLQPGRGRGPGNEQHPTGF